MDSPSTVELAWLAGLLEGEGTFGMITCRKGGKAYRYPKIAVNMTDEDIIARVARLFGTGVYKMPPVVRNGRACKQQWRAQISGYEAAVWMTRLRPWLGQRRRKRCDEVLTEFLSQEPTAVRRKRSCIESSKGRARDERGRFHVV